MQWYCTKFVGNNFSSRQRMVCCTKDVYTIMDYMHVKCLKVNLHCSLGNTVSLTIETFLRIIVMHSRVMQKTAQEQRHSTVHASCLELKLLNMFFVQYHCTSGKIIIIALDGYKFIIFSWKRRTQQRSTGCFTYSHWKKRMVTHGFSRFSITRLPWGIPLQYNL